jgi:hypothetical protein
VYLRLSYAHHKQRGLKGRQWGESLQAHGSGEVLLDHVASNSANTGSSIAFTGSASNAQNSQPFAVVQPLKWALIVFRLYILSLAAKTFSCIIFI